MTLAVPERRIIATEDTTSTWGNASFVPIFTADFLHTAAPMRHNITIRQLRDLQRYECSLGTIYGYMASAERDPVRRSTLLGLMHDEQRHCSFLSRYTGIAGVADRRRVAAYRIMITLMGSAFVLRQMSACAHRSAELFIRCCDCGTFMQMARDEKRHETTLRDLADSEPLSYISSVVLGLNDALVEFTGALAGFTLALERTELVALTGGITGIAAALSMGASEYLSTRTGRITHKHPLKAALCTFGAYTATVAILLMPYLFMNNIRTALAVMLTAAVAIIALFNIYYSVVRCESFWRRFAEMAVVSLGIAAVSFMVGYMFKHFTGINF